MASDDRAPAADEAMTLDEIAPRRRDARRDPQGSGTPSTGSRRRAMGIVGALVVVLVATGATVAAVAGPAPASPVGEGVAHIVDAVSTTTTVVTDPSTTTVAPTTTTIPPAPEADADIAATDCADDSMCGDIAPEGPCTDAGMCGEIRTDGECTDGEMCGDIPAPADCADPTMCGEIVPEPVPGGG